jgi:hypothetical protein
LIVRAEVVVDDVRTSRTREVDDVAIFCSHLPQHESMIFQMMCTAFIEISPKQLPVLGEKLEALNLHLPAMSKK